MNFDKHSKRNERRLPTPSRWIAIALAMVGLVAWLYYFSPKNEQSAAQNQASMAATLPQIVNAVVAGEVKTLTIRGDVLVVLSLYRRRGFLR